MFSNLPLCLADAIEKMQNRALLIIFPTLSYNEALTVSDLQSPQTQKDHGVQRVYYQS